MIQHIVCFRFQDRADVDEAIRRLTAMTGMVEGLADLKAGANFAGSPEFHLGLVTSHVDRAALAAYAADQRHQEVLNWLLPRLVERVAVDFEVS